MKRVEEVILFLQGRTKDLAERLEAQMSEASETLRFEDAARAAGCTKVLFDVIVGSPANAFYRQLGFRHWSNYMEKVL